MKKFLITLFVSLFAFAYAQEHACSIHKKAALKNQIAHTARTSALLPQLSHELKYDVKFVHLNLNLERTNKNVSGGVKTVATVTLSTLDTFQVLLHQNYLIDSVRFNSLLVSSLRQDSMIKIKAPSALPFGTQFTVTIFYHGTAPIGGAAIGNGFSNGTSGSWGNQVTWSLSESLAGYHWWPCKQMLTDKIDSSWVFVTTDSTNKVGSNGLLKNTVVVGNKKRFEWKSKTPIAYYLISVAVAKYKEYNLYAHPLYLPGDSILIQNYIYDNALNNTAFNTQKTTLNKMPAVLEFESKIFGMYPFYKEKYGHCMAPFGGGMEHQTMTSLGFFDYYVDAHELGHQWWGDNVTCKSWGDIWINEGFASYTEHVVAQYLDLPNFAPNLLSAHNNVMTQAGGSIYFTGNDTVNANRIFDSRLTYNKGGSVIRSLQFLTNNDSLWFNTLRSFQNTYKNNTASTINFMNHYQAQTGINPTQFFNQWYYGQGYPTFTVKYNQVGNSCIIKSTQSVSYPISVPLFVTPMEYKITRSGFADTIVRVMHSNTAEIYSFPILGTVTGIVCDPNNWIINKVVGPSLDVTITSIDKPLVDINEIKVGPNPTKGLVNVYSIPKEVKILEVLDVTGKLILSQKSETNTVLNLNMVAKGIYFIQFLDMDKKQIHYQKIIKE
jgi:aminopeptidase N